MFATAREKVSDQNNLPQYVHTPESRHAIPIRSFDWDKIEYIQPLASFQICNFDESRMDGAALGHKAARLLTQLGRRETLVNIIVNVVGVIMVIMNKASLLAAGALIWATR